jgi:cyclopropane-fatty-acyl-phospholipid synthase
MATNKMEAMLAPWVAKLKKKIDLPVTIYLGEKDEKNTGEGLKLGEFDQPLVTLRLRKASAVAHLLNPSLDSLGEAYVEGLIDVEGTVDDILALSRQLADAGDTSPGAMARIVRHFKHTKKSDKESIQYHYDVSNEFYQTWLDPRMLYSCAYYERGDESLEEAQVKKLDHILTKARVQPGNTLLDIGCGWGGLVIRAAQKFGAQCVGVTLSQNQFDLATERVKALGLQDKIEIRLQDYRDVEGRFDRITSVGMFEHVGVNYLEGYFRHIHNLLADDGWVLNHGITSTDASNGETRHGAGNFVEKYVFPHGELAHIGTVLKALQAGGLEPFDVENLRRHYARTTHEWSKAFEANGEKLRGMVAEKTWRIWRVYLAGCAWAFDNDEISINQVLARKSGQLSSNLPWSRQWMYAGR